MSSTLIDTPARDAAAAPNPNGLPDREAMGLRPGQVRRLPHGYAAALTELARCSTDELLAVLEPTADGTAAGSAGDAAHRLAAGRLLALLGDPRIDPANPALCDIAGGTVAIGLDPSQVAAVVERWAPVGVIAGWIAKECPRHHVALRPYRIGRYPVTNLEALAFVEATRPAELPSSWTFGCFPAERANHPVHTVSPSFAEAYCRWLSAETGRRFRLPTEAEWEHAAAGPAGHAFPWGDDWDPERANTVEAGPLDTTPVGVYPQGASPFGCLDLAGNVEEHVADDYAPYPGGTAVADDLAVAVGRYRIARGGSFTRYGDLARCSRRHGWYPRALYVMGFRLAEDVA